MTALLWLLYQWPWLCVGVISLIFLGAISGAISGSLRGSLLDEAAEGAVLTLLTAGGLLVGAFGVATVISIFQWMGAIPYVV